MDISSGEVLLENAIFPGKGDRNIPVAFFKAPSAVEMSQLYSNH